MRPPLIGGPLTLLLSSSPPPHRVPAVQCNFLAQFFEPPPNPADDYAPDFATPPAGLPTDYDNLHATAVQGVLAAIAAENDVDICEVEFPPIADVNSRGDGSAKSEARIDAANAAFVIKLVQGLKQRADVRVIGCSQRLVRALGGGAVTLRDAAREGVKCDVAICVSPADEDQWDAVAALGARCIVIVNGLLNNGRHQHAYYYKPLTAFSTQTGGCVRRYPGPYELWGIDGERFDLEIPLARQGRRALPDTKDAQLLLQNRFGARQQGNGGGRAGGPPSMSLARSKHSRRGAVTAAGAAAAVAALSPPRIASAVIAGTQIAMRPFAAVVAEGRLGPMAKYPDPTLRMSAAAVPASDFGPLLEKFGELLVAGMTSRAITALQYGVDARIIALRGISAPPPYTPLVLVNPRVIGRAPEAEMRPWREICLVLPPGLEIDVLRDAYVEVEYQDASTGAYRRQVLRGEAARAFQHEYDHLNGVLILDHAELDGLPPDIQQLEATVHEERQRKAFARPLLPSAVVPSGGGGIEDDAPPQATQSTTGGALAAMAAVAGIIGQRRASRSSGVSMSLMREGDEDIVWRALPDVSPGQAVSRKRLLHSAACLGASSVLGAGAGAAASADEQGTLLPRGTSTIDEWPAIPVWPTWGGGRVRPISPAPTIADPFLLLAHHKHSFTPGDPLRGPFRAVGGALGLPYVGEEGFKMHPHRGIDILTYVLDGSDGFRHRDSLGGECTYRGGAAQFMRSGRGAMHEEFWETRPDRTTRIELFQLWVNLPARQKMQPPALRYVGADWGAPFSVEEYRDARGRSTRVRMALDGALLARAESGEGSQLQQRPNVKVLHASLQPGATWSPRVEPDDTAMLYVRQGSVISSAARINAGSTAIFDRDGGNCLALTNPNTDGACDVLLLTGTPLREPVALGGPIVMNSRDELVKAYEELREGTFLDA